MAQIVTVKRAARSARQQIGLSLLILSMISCLSGCDEPFIVMSGGALKGTVVDPPEKWAEFSEVGVVQLETRPDDPYSVNIWTVVLDSDLYLATGDDPTEWTGFIDQDPDIRLRIGKNLFELEAVRVIDNREKGLVAAAYAAKYELDEEDNWVMDGQVFRLDRR